ncbi:MAG: hypothetical protein AB3N14_19530 [Flavobacteriaceae bacterium]
MKRIQLFEFEDFSWFPAWLRNCMTRLIVLLQRMMGTSQVLANLISKVLKEKQLLTIVDLGSGSGGVMPDVLELLRQDPELKDVKLTMTDLYPNEKIIKEITEKQDLNMSYYPTSVDATNIATAPAGLKTMVNSFHHMPPERARKILESAQQNHQPLLIYELGDNKMPLLVWWLLLPISLVILMIMVLFMTPFVRPLTWQQLVFTYLIPIIPICYAWDGQASLPRIYSLKDIDLLLEGLNSDKYTWTKGHALKKTKKQGIYVLGIPN